MNIAQKPYAVVLAAILALAAFFGTFLATFVVGVNLFAVPGSLDTGMVAIFCTPFYVILAVMAAAVVFVGTEKLLQSPLK
jgi:hypothetical protein